MKVIIMGSGIIGVTCAYFLAQEGYEVEVFEQEKDAGLKCSFANGGQLSFSHVEPFFSKTSFFLILKALLKPKSFIHIDNIFDKEILKFAFSFAKNFSKKKSQQISKNLFLLGQESKKLFEFIINKENIDFDYKNDGILHFYDNKKLFEKAKKQAVFQKNLGDNIEILSPEKCIKFEPKLLKLFEEKRLFGGILHKNDASGNAHKFCTKLKEICEKKYNVKFNFDTKIVNILTNYKKITGINTNKGVFSADNYICCFGAYSKKILNGIKIDPQILPIKGYSFSLPIDEYFIAPDNALTDPKNKIVYSNQNGFFRAAGMIEYSKNQENNKKLLHFLQNRIQNCFSDFGNMTKMTIWQGTRPFRANCMPLIKKSENYPNLFLNMGHGHLGFTLSCASAKIISDILSQKSQEKFAFLNEEKCKN